MDHQGGGKIVRQRTSSRATPYDRPARSAPIAEDAEHNRSLLGSLYAFAITPLRAVGGLLGVVCLAGIKNQ